MICRAWRIDMNQCSIVVLAVDEYGQQDEKAGRVVDREVDGDHREFRGLLHTQCGEVSPAKTMREIQICRWQSMRYTSHHVAAMTSGKKPWINFNAHRSVLLNACRQALLDVHVIASACLAMTRCQGACSRRRNLLI